MRTDLRTWLLAGAVVLGALASLVFMRPTLVAPVAGDDKTLYPTMAGYESWTPLSDVALVPEWWEQRTRKGRVNVVTLVERRTSARALVDTSVATNTPMYLLQGALKLLLSAASVLTLTALLKSLRLRRREGPLVRLSGGTVLLCTLAGGVLFAVGSQPQFLAVSGHNAWVNYPTNTYGAVVSIFGPTALVLWLTRLYAEGRHRVIAIITLALLAVITNFRYELVFPAVPLAVIALLMVPLTPRDRVSEGRRAKWVTGTAYAGVFFAVFVPLRWYLRVICDSGTCYTGVTPSLSADMLPTFWANVVSGIPGVGAAEATRFVTRTGTSAAGMYTPTLTSLLLAIGLGLALMLGWWLTRPPLTPPSLKPHVVGVDTAFGHDEARMLAIGAALCFLGALGAAGVMSLSESAQEGMRVGLLYRHTVVTWAGTAWALVLGILAVGRYWRRAEGAAWVALVLATVILAAVQLPANERSLAADRTVNAATTSAFAALHRGDLSRGANEYRCRLVPKMLLEPSYSGENLVEAFDVAFRRYWGQGFCQD